MALVLTRDRRLAEEIADHAIESAIEHPPMLGVGTGAWFWRVLQNALTDRLRRRASGSIEAWIEHSRRLDQIPARSLEEARDRFEATETLLAAVRRLSPEHRAIIEARFFGDMPLTQVARELGVPLRTVERRLSQAIDRLREMLKGVSMGSRAVLLVLLGPGRRGEAAVSSSITSGLVGTPLVVTLVSLILAAVAWTLSPLGGASNQGRSHLASLFAQGPVEQSDEETDRKDFDQSEDRIAVAPLPPHASRARANTVDEAAPPLFATPTLTEPLPTWNVTVELVINGANTTDWVAMPPLYDPDAARLSAKAPPKADPPQIVGERYNFNVEPVAGLWLLRLRRPGNSAVLWIQAPIHASYAMHLQFDEDIRPYTAANVLEGPRDLVQRTLIEPGVWLVSSIREGEPHVQVRGGNPVTVVPDSSFDPSAWATGNCAAQSSEKGLE